jgi:pyrimidine deaminase RibD-like protein
VSEDVRWLREAIGLAGRCSPSASAFSVGAIIVGSGGVELARGYSRETDDVVHAEEVALAKIDPGDPRLSSATLYSSLEPCHARKSRARSCTQLIVESDIPRVVFALREPPIFVAGAGGAGAAQLAAAGVEVVEIPSLADQARAANRHLTGPKPA